MYIVATVFFASFAEYITLGFFMVTNLSLSEHQKDLFLRAASLALSIAFSFIFTHLMFVVYMWEAGIFPYDLLEEGSSGFRIFYYFTLASLVLGAIAVAGVLIPVMRKIRGGPLNKFWAVPLGFLNAVVFLAGLSVVTATSGAQLSMWGVLVAFFVILALHLEALIFEPVKTQFRSLILLLVFSIAMCLVIPDSMARIWQFPLRHFGVGGALWVTVIDREGKFPTPIEGNLVLLTPRNIYVKVIREEQITLIPISASLKITTDRDRSFKDVEHAKEYMKSKGIHKPQLLELLEKAASTPTK